MGKEEDSLLQFLLPEKSDLESCGDRASEEEDKHEQQQCSALTCVPRPCHPFFWAFVAALLLILSLISGANQFFQFLPVDMVDLSRLGIPNGHAHLKVVLARSHKSVDVVPLQPVPVSGARISQAVDKISHPFPRAESGSVLGFDFERMAPDGLEGEAFSHGGRAYLTCQPSSDGRGVVGKSHSVGRLLYPHMLQMKVRRANCLDEKVVSFHTSFVFSIENSSGNRKATGDGLAFIMVPKDSSLGSAGGHLGVMSNLPEDEAPHTFAIEFDTWKNPSLNDISNNHVGINVGSMVSLSAADAGYWVRNSLGDERFQPLDLTSGKIEVWIDYDGGSQELSVRVSPIPGWKPARPLLKESIDLSKVLEKNMFVGFSAATGDFSAKHIIHSWQFGKSSDKFYGHEIEKTRDYRHWRRFNSYRAQTSRLVSFKNRHRPEGHGKSMTRPDHVIPLPTLEALLEEGRRLQQATSLLTLAALAQEQKKPMEALATMHKSCVFQVSYLPVSYIRNSQGKWDRFRQLKKVNHLSPRSVVVEVL